MTARHRYNGKVAEPLLQQMLSAQPALGLVIIAHRRQAGLLQPGGKIHDGKLQRPHFAGHLRRDDADQRAVAGELAQEAQSRSAGFEAAHKVPVFVLVDVAEEPLVETAMRFQHRGAHDSNSFLLLALAHWVRSLLHQYLKTPRQVKIRCRNSSRHRPGTGWRRGRLRHPSAGQSGTGP